MSTSKVSPPGSWRGQRQRGQEPGVTWEDNYDPAMAISDQAEADPYFERLVQHTFGTTREEAETIERANLGYWAGYYDHATCERVERLFRCEHSLFGSIAEKGPPTFAQALALGERLEREIAGVRTRSWRTKDRRSPGLHRPARSARSAPQIRYFAPTFRGTNP